MKTDLVLGVEKKLIMIAIALFLLSLGVQIVVLGTVGTTGPEISKLRSERENYRLGNEIKKAEIREFQTKGPILETAQNQFAMKQAEVKVINTTEAQAAAN
jgi:hypothetical protein